MGKNIYDKSIFYTCFHPIVCFSVRHHYHHIVVNGRDNLPTDGPYIIAPCHQNALMEPLAVLKAVPHPVVFLCRADIFAKPLARKMLTALKILPVYRIRDGKENLSKNNDIFEQSRRVLLANVPLCLMAEGRHTDKHQLLPLVKGMFRIAGETQQCLHDKPLYIVPTGIDFDEYERPYSNLVVSFGTPIDIRQFAQMYADNEPYALNQMREALTIRLKKQMHHIESKEHYQQILTTCIVTNSSIRRRGHLKDNAWNRFLTRKKISECFNNDDMTADELADADRIINICEHHSIRPFDVAEPLSPATLVAGTLAFLLAFTLLAILPTARNIALFALLSYPLLLLPTHLIAKKTIKDPQFRSSINFGIRFVLALIYTPILAIVMGIIAGWQWALAVLVATCITAYISKYLTNWTKRLFANWHIVFFKTAHHDEYAQLKDAIHRLDLGVLHRLDSKA